ncbi:putative flavoprotein [Xylaria palmicola]|nr:putative flavoprotein [Xylaria palmicola]
MPSNHSGVQDLDVLILGAGFSGVCALHHIREHFPQWRVKALEASSGVGGTWHTNRYPGARVDTESLTYQYSWDKELLNEWQWKETFSAQPDVLSYIERVCEKHDLYKDMQFNTRISSAHWSSDTHFWHFIDTDGFEHRARFFISCIGFLSTPVTPSITGIENFHGQSFHTSAWPKDLNYRTDLAGKKVGIIGTGATAIQAIPAMAKESNVESLTVFQRTANWSAPLRNAPISPEQMQEHAKEYKEIFAQCARTFAGFLYGADPRNSVDVTQAERVALWDQLYNAQGFGKWLGVFKDTYTSREANRLYSEYMAEKIRARIIDPEMANSLIPKNHGFGTRRVPLESGYFEVFNQPNVHLVDLKKAPIECISANGVQTQDGRTHELDVLVLATGFNAITGAFGEIDFIAQNGRALMGSSESERGKRAIWVDHKPKTFLGIMVPDMPNSFMVLGPHQPFGNGTRSLENAVDVIISILQRVHDHGYTFVEPKAEAVQAWGEHVVECSLGLLSNEVDSWMTGVNANVKGKDKRSVSRYSGNVVAYRKRCADCAKEGWEDLIFA